MLVESSCFSHAKTHVLDLKTELFRSFSFVFDGYFQLIYNVLKFMNQIFGHNFITHICQAILGLVKFDYSFVLVGSYRKR